MEKEIKEILDRMEEANDINAEQPFLDYHESNLLLDYITNLQEELQYQREAELEYNEKHIKLMQKYAELQQNYERIYNENCILREKHNITDISLLDENNNLRAENEKLKDQLEWYKQECDDLALNGGGEEC